MSISANAQSALDSPPHARSRTPLSLPIFVASLACVGVGSVGFVTVTSYRQNVAIRAIERLGGVVSVDDSGLWPSVSPEWKRAFGNVDSVYVGSPEFTDAEMVHLKRLSGLRALSFTHSQFSDSCFSFPGVPQEKREGRSRAHALVTDAGLAHVAELRSLRFLNLGNTPITDAGLVNVQHLTNLYGLMLDETMITDAGMAHLQEMKNLGWIDLSDTRITDAGLASLQGFANLRLLLLNDVQITDLGLSCLKGLTSLDGLALDHTFVSDAGMVHLKGMPSLRGVSLVGTKVTADGAANLRRMLPDVSVYR